MVGFLLSAIVKEGSVRCQSSIDMVFRYGWIHLLSTMVKEDSVSRQYLFRYGWIHLLTTIVKEDSVSRQSSIDRVTYSPTAIVKEDIVSQSTSVDRLNLLTSLYR